VAMRIYPHGAGDDATIRMAATIVPRPRAHPGKP
jgi:hypothetical protein